MTYYETPVIVGKLQRPAMLLIERIEKLYLSYNNNRDTK